MVQDFVKNRYNKLSKNLKDIKQNSLVAGASMRAEQLEMSDLNHGASNTKLTTSQVGSKGTIIEVVEEALKWRLEANNKKQSEVVDDVREKVLEQKRGFEVLSAECNTEFMEIKN